MNATLTFLGSGTSMGVPTLGCTCAVCTSTDPHDHRLRPSIAVRWTGAEAERVVLIDTGPDFREQVLHNRLARIDAVFYTHAHADHILGMDDLRPMSFAAVRRGGGPIPLFADPRTTEVLQRIFDYTFAADSNYPHRAKVELHPLQERTKVHDVDFIRIPLLHGDLEVSGFRFGNAAYLTDVSTIPESSFDLLRDLDVLVLDALRHTPHPTHANVKQALAWAERIGARQTWFTHISHDLGHEATNRTLPACVRLAYDGLSVPVIL
jgi:phosphoribosyl 1,2-cyclic phosphate phosphodiesterase